MDHASESDDNWRLSRIKELRQVRIWREGFVKKTEAGEVTVCGPVPGTPKQEGADGEYGKQR
jgi:hypothetical protein